ncbi:hypothetical protein V5799_015212 [Amblyomma americanum]|uniref:Uncharacterized protein n=1 Tax=Amblyomma americanum TaxID=6943 RepID=A0AAQ4E0T3_AMBAM
MKMRKHEEKRSRKRRFWVHPEWKARKKEGEYHTSYKLMRKDPHMFFQYYRMTPQLFDELHRIIKRDLEHQFLCREPFCSEERLAITIQVPFLSNGHQTGGHGV